MNYPSPFSKRQQEYFFRCFSPSNWFHVAEGGKRGGKNVLQTLAFCSLLETHKNKIHLIAGVSVATAKLNILDCDGYGLLNYFEGRCREGKYKDRDCVYVKTKTGEKVVLVSGGGKDGDEKLIKGNTYGMAYVTEANECHIKFLKEVFDRTVSSSDRKVFHDLNPKEEEHWYYTDILSFHQEQQEKDESYGYNYGHFTLVDNMSLSDAKIRKILTTYNKGSVWYRRDIKGERAVAEGIIFRRFAEDNTPYLYEDKELFDERGELKRTPSKVVMGIDFGGNGSMTTFVCTLYYGGYHDFYAAEEDSLPLSQDIDADKICNKFVEFYKMCLSLFSMTFGFGSKKYTFENGQIQTATQYIGERQDSMQELNKQRKESTDYISHLLKAMMWFSNTFCNTSFDLDAEVCIDFDDSYIEDKNTRIESLRTDAQFFSDIPEFTIRFIMERLNVDREEAVRIMENREEEEDPEQED